MESDGEFIMAVKYLSGNRLWGTDAERLAMTTTSATTYTGDMSTGWTQTDAGADFTIDGTDDEIDFHDSYNANNVYFDLSAVETLSTSAWCLRFTYQITGSAVSDNPVFWVGISNTGVTASNTTETDYLGFGSQTLNGTTTLAPYLYACDDNRLDQADVGQRLQLDSSNVNLVSDNTKYYIQVVRDSGNFTVKVFSNSGFSTLLCEKSNAVITDETLKYFIVANYIQGSNVTGTLSEMKWWNGTTDPSSYPNLPNGSVFITSDTNVHYMWNSSAETWHEVA